MKGETGEELFTYAKKHGIEVHGYTEETWNEIPFLLHCLFYLSVNYTRGKKNKRKREDDSYNVYMVDSDKASFTRSTKLSKEIGFCIKKHFSSFSSGKRSI
jgi:hypothetical protein